MNCKYCAQDERLDQFGYCQKYNCFERSGEKSFLDKLIIDAKKLYFNDETKSISGPVSNTYSKNHRTADDLKYKAIYRLGHVPFELIKGDDDVYRYYLKEWFVNIQDERNDKLNQLGI